ncbi:transcriptional repressor [Alkaliphilus pronyensis]|uniref:Transcriptional repressor n=1 Tax=Alkaliphilus pronyensis TaxID=1482732 RepID=A0A6I0F7T9_9FIRM|nr:Fur family transcriptional regulator [Alkaliphilus pronyensis]KAB3530303.1 transcriptional repressor [Alkaliphilus pronyensis]
MKKQIKDIVEYLVKHNIKPSYPRIKILEALIEKDSHPNVDEIYNSLLKDAPTLSKTTVYNTLNVFAEAGIVKVLIIDGKEARYDIDTIEHGHFKCDNCDNITDLNISIDDKIISELQGFKIKEKRVYCKGICNKCLSI